MTIAVQLNHVSKTIKGREILKDVTLTVNKGSIVGFVGHNGSGKSMLFRIIAGLVKPTSGEVSLFGETLHRTISFPKSAGIILEKPGFLEQYSEQVALVGQGSRHSLEDGVDDDENGFAIGDADDDEGGDGKHNGWANSRTHYPPSRSNGHAGGYQAVYDEEES